VGVEVVLARDSRLRRGCSGAYQREVVHEIALVHEDSVGEGDLLLRLGALRCILSGIQMAQEVLGIHYRDDGIEIDRCDALTTCEIESAWSIERATDDVRLSSSSSIQNADATGPGFAYDIDTSQ